MTNEKKEVSEKIEENPKLQERIQLTSPTFGRKLIAKNRSEVFKKARAVRSQLAKKLKKNFHTKERQ